MCRLIYTLEVVGHCHFKWLQILILYFSALSAVFIKPKLSQHFVFEISSHIRFTASCNLKNLGFKVLYI